MRQTFIFFTMVLLILGSMASLAQTEIYYVHNDHLGTPQVVTDENQNVVWQGEYGPFGELFSESGTLDQPIRFPGQIADPETGHYYNYYRDYDPTLGRYIQSDPIGLAGGMNTYAYVGGNPLVYSDPYGLAATIPYNLYRLYRAYQAYEALVSRPPLTFDPAIPLPPLSLPYNNDQSSDDGGQCPVPGAKPGRPVRGDRTKNWEVTGRDPHKDFDNQPGKEFTPKGGPLPDSRFKEGGVNLHPSSGKGPGNYPKGTPTLEIPRPGGGVDKIRYL